MVRAADQVVPFERGIVVEPETPVRLDALGLEARAIGIAQPQRRAIVDRRQPAPKLDLALAVHFLRGLICRIDAPAGAQGLEPRLVQSKTTRLPFLAVRQIRRPSCWETVGQSE